MNLSLFLGAIAMAVTMAATAQGQLAQPSSVADAVGSRSTGGPYSHISAGGQPGGIAQSFGASFIHQAGFLNTFFLKPGLDTDGNGLPDEADADNDGDMLTDITELTGVGFSPITVTDLNRADTDGDAVSDGSEAVAGTDPTDPTLYFRLVSLQTTTGGVKVGWVARGNNDRTYVLNKRAGLLEGGEQVIFSNTVAGGSPPWFVVTNAVLDAVSTSQTFYHVRVRP